MPRLSALWRRRKTLRGWDPASPVRAVDLAESGFYWPKEHRHSDRVRCHHCGVEIEDWADGDDPHDQHIKHTRSYVGSGCEFALRQWGHAQWLAKEGAGYYEYLHRGERGQWARRGRSGKMEVSRPVYRTYRRRRDIRPVEEIPTGPMQLTRMPSRLRRRLREDEEKVTHGPLMVILGGPMPRESVAVTMKCPGWTAVPIGPAQ